MDAGMARRSNSIQSAFLAGDDEHMPRNRTPLGFTGVRYMCPACGDDLNQERHFLVETKA